MAAVQRSFDDVGTPLQQVTFVVVDLETTGCAPGQSAITEVGAVKLRGGQCLATFQTLAPGSRGPPEITYLTGITEAMVVDAPRIEAVLPSFLEFLGDAVVVGHNVRFDLSFLAAALRASGRPRLTNRWVDTCALARRLVADEVANCKLSTLARHFRVGHQPTHRALDDALATGEVLHFLLERAGNLGVLALDDLLELPTVRGHPMVAKLAPLRLRQAHPRRALPSPVRRAQHQGRRRLLLPRPPLVGPGGPAGGGGHPVGQRHPPLHQEAGAITGGGPVRPCPAGRGRLPQRRAGRVSLEVEGGGATLDGGRLVRAWVGAEPPAALPFGPSAADAAEAGDGALPTALPFRPEGDDPGAVSGEPLPRHLADEVLCVASWLERSAAGVRLGRCDNGLPSPLPYLPRFEPGPAAMPGR